MTHFPHVILDALMHRNIADIDELLQSPSISRLTGSVILEGMADATDRILLAVREREPILLFGDYVECVIMSSVTVHTRMNAARCAHFAPHNPFRASGV